jgi:DNA-binding transcriptional LysR family regulator
VLVAPNGTAVGLVDRTLAEHGLSRRIARTLPTFVDAAYLVAHSDYVVALPLSLIEPLAPRLRLKRLPVPVDLPRFTISMAWHRRHDGDPAHVWFRAVLRRAAAKVAHVAQGRA